MTSISTPGAEPILLAFSGGLDTSFCVPWLKDTYGRPVITVTVDTGGIDAAAAQSLAERSRQLGAIGHHLIDARMCLSDFSFGSIQAHQTAKGVKVRAVDG